MKTLLHYLISQMRLLLSAIYRRTYIQLRRVSSSLEKNVLLQKKNSNLDNNNKPHLRACKHTDVLIVKVLWVLSEIKKHILTSELSHTCW